MTWNKIDIYVYFSSSELVLLPNLSVCINDLRVMNLLRRNVRNIRLEINGFKLVLLGTS